MILKGTTDKLQIVLNDRPTNEFEVVVAYTNITSTTIDVDRVITITDGTSVVDLIASIASGTKVRVEKINVYNPDPLTWIVTIQVYDGTNTRVVRSVDLQPGETLTYSCEGWAINPGNNAGGIITLPVSATTQLADAGNPIMYGTTIANKDFLSLSNDVPIEQSLWKGGLVLYFPYSTTGIWLGTAGANLGSATSVVPTITNRYTLMRRTTFASVVTTLNQQVGTRTESLFLRGNSTDIGGFFAVCDFGFEAWTAGDRLFVGFSSGTTAVVTVQPSTLFNIFGFCIEAGDTAITLLHNDGAGTGTKDTITEQPTLAANQGYRAYLYCKPNDNVVYWRLDDLNTGTLINEGSVSSDLPVNTTFLCFQAIMSNGANTPVNSARIGVGNIYLRAQS